MSGRTSPWHTTGRITIRWASWEAMTRERLPEVGLRHQDREFWPRAATVSTPEIPPQMTRGNVSQFNKSLGLLCSSAVREKRGGEGITSFITTPHDYQSDLTYMKEKKKEKMPTGARRLQDT